MSRTCKYCILREEGRRRKWSQSRRSSWTNKTNRCDWKKDYGWHISTNVELARNLKQLGLTYLGSIRKSKPELNPEFVAVEQKRALSLDFSKTRWLYPSVRRRIKLLLSSIQSMINIIEKLQQKGKERSFLIKTKRRHRRHFRPDDQLLKK